MTSLRRLTLLGVACLTGITTPSLLLLRMRAGVPAPSVKKASLQPLLAIPRARFGGTVTEVCVKPGDRVEAGQILLKFDTSGFDDRLINLRKAGATTTTMLERGDAIDQIPPQVRQNLLELHPDIQKAEREYMDALAAVEHGTASDPQAANARLQRAAEDRVRARRDLGSLFGRKTGADRSLALAEIGRSIDELQKAREDAEVRAASSAVVDVIEARVGQKFQPGQPVALLVSSREYLIDLHVTADELKSVRQGTLLTGELVSSKGPIQATVESISTRKLPVIARENLAVAEDLIVRARVVSATPLQPGAMTSFSLPSLSAQ